MIDDITVAYRPAEFTDMVGQDAIVASLQEMESSGKWSHAYLLTGHYGSGKTTTARIIAAKLGVTVANIMEIDAATHTGIDAMRSLTSGLQYTGFGTSPKKMIVLDECHALSKASWQSLLKVIEEPPEHVYFAFCTTEPGKVLPTIKSRCISFHFKPVKVDDLVDLLLDVADDEKIDLPEKDIALIARESDGSPRQALSNLAKCRGCVSRDEIVAALEAADENSQVIDLCRLLVGSKLTWKKYIKTIQAMEDVNPESVRIQVINYLSVVISKTESENNAGRILEMISAFSEPFNQSDKMAPLHLAFGSIILGE